MANENKKPMRSLTVSGRLSLAMHSLNNEGTEGNQQITRMATVVRPDGMLDTVNAISGDMFKHILAEHLLRAAEKAQLPLSAGAKEFSANRIMRGGDFAAWIKSEEGKSASQADVIRKVIGECAITDLLGILITEGGKSVPRKSVVEFGWVVGIPDAVRTDSFFHVKYDPSRGASRDQEQQTGQAIFHRPASSGRYATVVTVELDRIGFNDIDRTQVIIGDDQTKRRRAVLESLLATFVEPAGAHRNTQNPHIVGFDGVISISRGSMPAPTVSALNPDFQAQIKNIADALNKVDEDTIEIHPFDNLAGFAQTMAAIIAPDTALTTE